MSTASAFDKDTLIENVCERCPGTCWGDKSICRVHDLHIGSIQQCQEWDKYMIDKQGLRDHDGQLALTDLEPAMEWLQRTEEEIRDYSFTIREINRLKTYLEDAGEGTVAAYGIDASQPKGKGSTGDKTHQEVAKRERYWKRLKSLEESVQRVERAMETIKHEKERAVLDCMIDGVRMNMIARHVGVSRSYLNDLKRDLIRKMAWAMYGEDQLKVG